MLYVEKHWGFNQLRESAQDSRKYCTITASDVFISIFMLFALRMRSFNCLEQAMKYSARFEKLMHVRKPSVDILGYSLSRFNLACLRRMLATIAHKAKRSKALKRTYSGREYHWVAALDGHELWSGTKRCCSGCLTREIDTKNGKQVQYYHKIVALQMTGVTPALLLDIEPVLPGGGEVAAALRIIRRARKYYPRFFDVICADALFLIKPFVEAVLEEGYNFVIVLKQKNRELYRDVSGLMEITDCKQMKTDNGEIQLWDFEHLKTWTQLDCAVRVVCSNEKTAYRTKGAHSVVESHWRWVTNMPASTVPPETIWRWGHARWDIENRGFNELVQHWHMDHCFRHHPTAIIAMLMILAMAFSLTTLFFERNLKPDVKKNNTRLFLAALFMADFLTYTEYSLDLHPT